MNHKGYASASVKCQVGPGGLRCSCCTHFHTHKSKSKPLMRRIRRRTDKLALRSEVLS